MSRTRLQIVFLVLFWEKRALTQGRSTHLCRETMVNKQLFSCVKAASSESLAYYQTHFFFLFFFYI